MFRRRLTWFSLLLGALALLLVARLAQIQLAQAAHYQELGEQLLTRTPEYIVAPRGTIYDRRGTPLVQDQPCADICVHYALLADPEHPARAYLTRVARALRRRGEYPAETPLAEIVAALEQDALPYFWRRLATITDRSVDELWQWAAEIRTRIERWRAAARQKRIREEDRELPLLEDVAADVALAVRLELEYYPWIQVRPGARRVVQGGDSLVHVLGRLGTADPQRLAADPLAGDELRSLRQDDRCGLSGVERLAETSLRGQRGRVTYDRDWQAVERVPPVAGHDVHLTIDLELQEYVLGLLERTVRECRFPSGAAAVVIDVATREVRALASYPVYRHDELTARYDELQRDAERLPLLFRAVQAQYPPGSICKAITLVGGLSEGLVSADTRIHCTGHLLAEFQDRFRCWIYNEHPGLTHDMTDDPDGQSAESAVRNSCNIYFFRVGERLGPARLCEWFTRFGLGRSAGAGLIEESTAIVPTEEWLLRNQGRRTEPADAWNFAIGQGEVTITPLQAANVAASVAAGEWAPVRLAYDDTGHAFADRDAAPPVPLDEQALRVLRRGMWRVVNERGGTAVAARLDRNDYVLCGKTGSAQTPPRAVAFRYTFEWPDGRRDSVISFLEEDALAEFPDPKPRRVGKHTVAQYPSLHEGEKWPAHAWFIGHTQLASTPRGEKPRGRVYAIAVLIEFGETGGRVAGPVAKQIAEFLLASSADP
jgi:cell division protein FtsI/penicillin-binding protein 2